MRKRIAECKFFVMIYLTNDNNDHTTGISLIYQFFPSTI